MAADSAEGGAWEVSVDVTSPTPPYEQIRGQVAAAIAGGQLTGGSRLPTIRALAADLGLATGTVGRAYRELEAAGLVTSRRRLGTVVTGAALPAAAASDVHRAAADLATRARQADMDEETAVSLLRAAFAATRSTTRP